MPGGAPEPVDEHEVFLILPEGFPVQAPLAIWQTPVYHPNIDLETGKVCLGALEDRYRPAMDFGELCQILVDMAGYRNYEVREGYNTDAAEWAVSPEGRASIEARGGQSVDRMLWRMILDEVQDPLPLRIRRCDP